MVTRQPICSIATASSSVPAGEWLSLTADWAHPVYVACDLCGRPLSRRAWSADVDGEQVAFCDPDCERLLHEYWRPRHGASVTGADET